MLVYVRYIDLAIHHLLCDPTDGVGDILPSPVRYRHVQMTVGVTAGAFDGILRGFDHIVRQEFGVTDDLYGHMILMYALVISEIIE